MTCRRCKVLENLLIEALEELDANGRTDHADIYRRACAAMNVRVSPDIILTRDNDDEEEAPAE